MLEEPSIRISVGHMTGDCHVRFCESRKFSGWGEIPLAYSTVNRYAQPKNNNKLNDIKTYNDLQKRINEFEI